jgi:UDP-glucuronate 4-epimerase
VKILITGGAGFIGSHLAERLLAAGHSLLIIDDLNDFYAPEMKEQNLAAIRQKGHFVFHGADIRCVERMLEIVQQARPQAIVHLAARAGVRPSLEQPLLYEEVNVRGTMALLEAARIAEVRKFVFASSSSIYGLANQAPFRENDHDVMPISPYAATKIAGEKLCYTYSYLYGISVVCLRFFTVYGPRQRPDLAIRKFTEMIDCGLPIPVFGDGSTGRDYTYVDDIVNGIVAALHYSCSFDVFNLGNSHPIGLSRMISAIESALGIKAVLRHLPEQPGDVPLTYADITKAARLLNYHPVISFEEGVERFVEWYRRTPALSASQYSFR